MRRTPLLPLLVLTVLPGAGGIAAQDAASIGPVRREPIRWVAGPEVLPAFERAGVASALRDALEGADRRHVVVQLAEPPSSELRRSLASAGVELGRPLGAEAWFATVSRGRLDEGALERLPVASASAIRTAWKLHPELAAGRTPTWSVLGLTPERDLLVGAYVLFHRDVELVPTARDCVRAVGGRVSDWLESVNGLVVELPRGRIAELAEDDAVQWIEPPLPRFTDVNDSVRSRIQAEELQQAPFGLDGSGVTVLVYDGGTARATHVDFGGRLTVRDASGLSNHATHVAGTIGGDGSATGGRHRGMAPGATLESYGFEDDWQGIFLYTNPGDFESDYEEAILVHGADLANNSIGTNTETNGFPCNIQGDYGVMSSLVDAVVRGSLGVPFRVVWAAGNERQGSFCDLEGFGDYYSTAPPATAKNHITVGAVNSNDDSMTTFSSWGPTDDGRLKPDVCAPGCQTNDDFGVTSAGAASDVARSTLCGTSMASPAVAGVCALLLQDHRLVRGGPDPRNSTLKALLAHTAEDLGTPGPDHRFGFGSVRARAALELARLGRFTEGELDEPGSSTVFSVAVAPGQPELRLTLAWDDAPGVPNVFGALVNDLDLLVVDPLGARHHPWTLDPADPGAPAVRSAPDHTNNIEQVLVDAPLPGPWTVTVLGRTLPEGPQPFSLVSSHDLVGGPHVRFGFPAPLPAELAPGIPHPVTVRITPVGDALVPGSPTLRVRYASGSFLELPLVPRGGDLYEGLLPPAVCGAAPELWFRAEGVASGAATSPPGAPAETYTASVGTTSSLFADDFELDRGWTVQNGASLTDGAWQRGLPAGDGGRGDPLADADGSGRCFLTDNAPGNSDVDGGPTRLVSPLLDLGAAADPWILYSRWLANDDFDSDALEVEVSGDGGATWVLADSVGNTGGWTSHACRLADHVLPTSAVRVRFSVADEPNDSVTEAAVDAFRVLDVRCAGSLADCNANGIDDLDDVASGRSGDCDGDGVPDECEPDRDGDGVPDDCDPGRPLAPPRRGPTR